MAQLLSPVCTDSLKFQNPLSKFPTFNRYSVIPTSTGNWRLFGQRRSTKRGLGKLRVATDDPVSSSVDSVAADDYYAVLGLVIISYYSFGS